MNIINNDDVALIISDIGLDDMAGIAFAKTVKIVCEDLPVILITGLLEKYTKETTLSCEADGFLRKTI